MVNNGHNHVCEAVGKIRQEPKVPVGKGNIPSLSGAGVPGTTLPSSRLLIEASFHFPHKMNILLI